MLERLENPVFRQSSRQRMRGARTYGCLIAYLFILALVIVFAYNQLVVGGQLRSTSGLAQILFEALVATQWLLVGVITPALTTSAITMEREQRTIDLLLITPLSRLSIVWGKFTSAMAFLVVLILCGMPLVAVLFLLGGIDSRLLLARYAMMLLTGAVLAAFGLTMSAVCATSTLANLLTYGGLAVGYFVAAVAGVTFVLARAFGGSAGSFFVFGTSVIGWQAWAFALAGVALVVVILLQIAANYLLLDPRVGAWKTRLYTAGLYALLLLFTVVDARSLVPRTSVPNYIASNVAPFLLVIAPVLFTGVPYTGVRWYYWLLPANLRVGTVQSAWLYLMLLLLASVATDVFSPASPKTHAIIWVYLAGYFWWVWSLGYLFSMLIRNRWGALFALLGSLAAVMQLLATLNAALAVRGRVPPWIEQLPNLVIPMALWESSQRHFDYYATWAGIYLVVGLFAVWLAVKIDRIRQDRSAER
jgi:ABC-type transport system involved in multi-copper enzyme maturation permease subunit